MAGVIRVGLIADTHGLLRPEAMAFLQGSNRIVHAGDIGALHVLAQLRSTAQLHAVRGNNDTEPWAADLPDRDFFKVGSVGIYVLHDLADLRDAETPAGVHIVIAGHSHKPSIEDRNGMLFLNPGSAGPRRFKLPVAAAELEIKGCRVRTRIVDLTSRDFAHTLIGSDNLLI